MSDRFLRLTLWPPCRALQLRDSFGQPPPPPPPLPENQSTSPAVFQVLRKHMKAQCFFDVCFMLELTRVTKHEIPDSWCLVL